MRKIIYLLAMMIANYAIEAQVKTPQQSPKSTVNIKEREICIIYHTKS